MSIPQLAVFSPLPPKQNGIADYTYDLLKPLRAHYAVTAFTDELQADVPYGVSLADARQAFRYLEPNARILHQIGNNPDHVFVLHALRNWGGVVTLHDQNLHYLYEVARTEPRIMYQKMMATAPAMGSVYARHWQETGLKTHANYMLFDMLGEVLETSTALIVHSQYAKNRLGVIYGKAKAEKVAVIPHLAMPFDELDWRTALWRLEIPIDRPLIVTCGFATYAKRFDWMVEALNELCERNIEFFWVHAGKERPDEYALSELISRFPAVRERSRVTGYLTDSDLNCCINAAALIVNLRFPSVGESSGTLARAMAAGKCCVVSDTAAYSELPRDGTVHVPTSRPVPQLVAALEDLLTSPERAAEIGARARDYAAAYWSPESVAQAYADVIEDTAGVVIKKWRPASIKASPVPIAVAIDDVGARDVVLMALAGVAGPAEIYVLAANTVALAAKTIEIPQLLSWLLPNHFDIESIKVVATPYDGVFSNHTYDTAFYPTALCVRGAV